MSIYDHLFVLGLLVPGVIIQSVRSQFLTGRSRPLSEMVLHYYVVSIIYYALILLVLENFVTEGVLDYSKLSIWTWVLVILIGPAFCGLLLGINIKTNFTRRLLQKVRVNSIHPMPTAWDWKFADMPMQWVLVMLKDGTRFGGLLGSESFISGDPNERDIYIQWIYDIDDNNIWSSRGENGVLITAGEIRTVEFWPYCLEENTDERQ